MNYVREKYSGPVLLAPPDGRALRAYMRREEETKN